MNKYLEKYFTEEEKIEQRKLSAFIMLYNAYDMALGFIQMEYLNEKEILVNVLNKDLGFLIDTFVVNEDELEEENISSYEEIVRKIRYCYTPHGEKVEYGSVNKKPIAFNLNKNNTCVERCKWYNEYYFTLTTWQKALLNGVEKRKQIFQ